MAAPNKQFPKDGQVIISIMKDFGITNYEPRVVNMLMEFGIRYVTCILDDARAYANHSSNRKLIDSEDVKLAVMMQLEKIFTTPPPRDLLLEVARTKNSVPLPLVKPHCGIRLPPDRYCFSSCNYKLKTNPKAEKPPQFEKKNKLGPSSAATLSGPSKINKPANSTFNVVKRPANISTVARTQPAPNVTKPVLKVVESYGGEWTVSGQSAAAKAMVKVAGQPQVEVKIEPQDSPMESSSLKRKLDDH
ncbi:Transcription initiation factor TFIID [Nesidiocoris tenuis]|uniref:Transcription initiation factor TFIID n=1 Tax=Nesidiocoris tenuis TaxID=355587 RepID=A0ABN7ATM8_9HEMI|nr:Transcription initiation factor TFIID [Nesidiocoris tenuis]